MDRKEKEQVISEAIQLLAKNNGIYLKVNRMWTDSGYFNVALDYAVNGKEKRQQFGFVGKWFDPNYFEFSWVKNLQIPEKANDYQRVLLKMSYYFYKWYKEACQ